MISPGGPFWMPLPLGISDRPGVRIGDVPEPVPPRPRK